MPFMNTRITARTTIIHSDELVNIYQLPVMVSDPTGWIMNWLIGSILA